MKRTNPFEELERVVEQFNHMIPRSGSESIDMWNGLQNIPVDVADYEDEIVVTADVPGVDKEDLNVRYVDGGVEIKAESTKETGRGDENYHYQERRLSSAKRFVALPVEVKEEEAEGTYTNGVLTLRFPKVESEEKTEGSDINIE